MSDETEPVFHITVRTKLDPDDDDREQTANVRDRLVRDLEAMKADGLIRRYNIRSSES